MSLLKKKYQLLNIYNLIFKENFKKKINFDWSIYPLRYTIIQNIIDRKKYKSYLEIGCFKNETFNKINVDKKIGVDPESGGNIRSTSDDFFISNKNKFDIIFIDGLHIYEQVKKDISNSLEVLNENGILLLHDCLPEKIRDQMVPRSHEKWNGDVWKAIVECRTLKNIDTYTCLADQGIGVILKRENKKILNIKIKNFKKLKFKDYYYNYKEYMNLIDINSLLSM
tara:strand:- start:518 stop:1192 length:675 start_codon:yes stop_codon:yes gene_type:complete